jgi:hypothetical protein
VLLPHDSRRLAGLLALLVAAPAPGADHFLLVGGGPTPQESQVSIENNVMWIEATMTRRSFTSCQTLFASGASGRPDVVLNSPDDDAVARWLPLARLHGLQGPGASIYRPGAVAGGGGAATAERVGAALRRTLLSLGDGDSLFLVYSGHGSEEPTDTSRNALRLWGESRLDVRTFTDILRSAPPGATVRYVFPQCHSGAFARSIGREPAAPQSGTVATNRCGFFSVADDRIAEGCTPSVDAVDYRDYSTFFFAALAGRTRTGDAISLDPDTDRDGRVTLLEAHAYAFIEGLSTDVPRTTSEYYLEIWEPWYLRWHTFVEVGLENQYFKLAVRLGERLGLDTSDAARLSRHAAARRGDVERRIERVEASGRESKQEESTIRKALLREFEREWPNAIHAHSAAYARFVESEATEAIEWLRRNPEFSRLARLQDDIAALEMDALALRREAASFDRVRRAVRLAAILEHFESVASDEDRRAYELLRRCESWSPPPAVPGSQR